MARWNLFSSPNAGTPSAPPAADSDSDAALMRRVAAGERSALATLIERHQPRVWAVAYRFSRRPDDADDLTQETFLRLWRSAAGYRPTASLTTFLYRIVLNLWVDLQRKRARGPAQWPAELPDPPATADRPAGESAERDLRVRREIDALPERQRTVLILHRYEELSLRQIVEATGWSEGAVESLLSRAYAQLRQRLAEVWKEA